MKSSIIALAFLLTAHTTLGVTVWYDSQITWIQATGWTSSCDPSCVITSDPSAMSEADAILYDRHTGLGSPPDDKAGKRWVDYNTDATSIHEEPVQASAYDVHVNFLPSADVQATFAIDVTQTNTSIDTSVYSTSYVASALLMYCPGTPDDRMTALDAISASVPTMSYGPCMHNAPSPYIEQRSDYTELSTAAEKYQAIQDEIFNTVLKYRFFLAFEDADEPYYVTDQAFNALKAGVVPVYMGTTDVSSYLPVNSYIDIRNFDTIQDLNNHLMDAFYNDDVYLQYHEWRGHMGDPDWMPAIGPENSRETALCRLCTFLTA